MEIKVKQFHNPELQASELDKCLKRLKKELEREKILKELKDRQFYRKPSEIRREKEKMIKSLIDKRRRKKEAWEDKWGDMKFMKKPQAETETAETIQE